ncbi:hypothetical protein OEIGOIKO_04867 [Streptomyces chrestomyceticus JCM 4735]|uniref:Uncharacterized protein n=1 Tax=Streptomyces chrestomyceticus JCM 4735 TaxID=1306181 RepID=A0A7U9KXA3_9ACTN|nr:hypothetical protein [Streptomyces chrestomyceticus]GCD37084.1 hypothetical protein OEIGOIKO_04867 [Streptomyces chrestomyceticus JCM 4735]
MRLRPVLATAAAVLSLSASGLTGAAVAAAPADPAPPVSFGGQSNDDSANGESRGERDYPGTIGWGHKPYQLLGDRNGRYVITAVNKTDTDRLPTCYRDLYATPASSICH